MLCDVIALVRGQVRSIRGMVCLIFFVYILCYILIDLGFNGLLQGLL